MHLLKLLISQTGSFDVERSFSVLNHIRMSSRHNLNAEHIRQMMLIRINGPKDASKFDGIPYALYWFQIKHFRLVDFTMKAFHTWFH